MRLRKVSRRSRSKTGCVTTYSAPASRSELGVAVAGERPDAADHRDLHVSDALEESLQKIQVEDRLRDDIFGAGFHFPVEAADLFVQVQRAGVGPHADQQGGL